MPDFPTEVTSQIMTIHPNLKPGVNFQFLFFFPLRIFIELCIGCSETLSYFRKHYHILGDFIVQEAAV